MARDESDDVTRSEAVQAWRDDRSNLSIAKVSALTREGAVLHDRNAGVYLRIVEEPAKSGPASERLVGFEDGSGERVEYQLDRVWLDLINGDIEPVPQAVVENTSKIVREIAGYELAQLDTLSRNDEYSVVAHTETLADAQNAVQLDNIGRFEEKGEDDS